MKAADLTRENPALDLASQMRQEKNAQDKVEFATTADKILGLLADEPISIYLTDKISLQFYPPTDEQYLEILTIQGDGAQIAAKIGTLGLNSGITDEEAEQIMPQAMGIIHQAQDMLDTINEMLASLSVDKAWTPAKFKQLPKKYKSMILKGISSTQEGELAKTEKFRKKRGRDRVITNAPGLASETS